MDSLKWEWALGHFSDEVLKDLALANGKSYKELKAMQEELETRHLPQFEDDVFEDEE
jgi:hypothetical protein